MSAAKSSDWSAACDESRIPLVSVVMSVFNGEPYLTEAVESLLAQSQSNFEFVIVDDGSTDRTGAILDGYARDDPRVLVHRRINAGLVSALNFGCSVARGKYIARMDADDVSTRDRLMLQVEFMEAHPNVGAVGGAVDVIDAGGRHLTHYRNPLSDAKIKLDLLRGLCPLWHPAVLMRAAAWRAVGGYRSAVVHAEDLDLWLRIADGWALANLGSTVLRYRRHPLQVSISRFQQQALSSLVARMAAQARKRGATDPIDGEPAVTPRILGELGIDESMRDRAKARAYVSCLRSLIEARQAAAAERLLQDWLASPHSSSRPVRADMYLLQATLRRVQRRPVQALLCLARAIAARPAIVGRPLKLLVRSCPPLAGRPPGMCHA